MTKSAPHSGRRSRLERSYTAAKQSFSRTILSDNLPARPRVPGDERRKSPAAKSRATRNEERRFLLSE